MAYVTIKPKPWRLVTVLTLCAIAQGWFTTMALAPAHAQPMTQNTAPQTRTITAFSRLEQNHISLAAARHSGLNQRLLRLLRKIEIHFRRPLIITSGCRSRAHNRRVGGARRSMHLQCKAADFKITGIQRQTIIHYVRRLSGVGGIGTYCRNSIVHIDVGPSRSWRGGCRKKRRI